MKKIINKIKNIFDNSKAKNLLSIFIIIGLIALVAGVTFAYGSREYFTGLNAINSADVSMSYTEKSNVITLDSAVTITDDEGKILTDYFDFSVTSTATPTAGTEYDLTYSIVIEPLEADTGYTLLNNNQIKVYLENKDNGNVLVEPTLISNLNDSEINTTKKVLLATSHTHSTSAKTVTTNYRLRAWIDYDNSNPFEWANGNYEYKFRVNINEDRTLYNAIALNVKSDVTPNFRYINNDDIDVDDSGVFLYNGTDDNNGDQNIYYYRGNVENNNVLFGGFCWKIIRTTSTGGVKMIYNGTPKEIYDQDMIPIEQSDYQNLDNSASYPFTYDSDEKTWTSGNYNVNSSTSQISFTINNSDNKEYYLNYEVSSESYYDKAYFYKDGVQLGLYSGDDSGIISLGKINSSSVIKVKYTKDSSWNEGDDNVIFSVGTYPDDATKISSCDNSGDNSQLSSESSFESTLTYLAPVGYMHGNTNYYNGSMDMTPIFNSSAISTTYIDILTGKNMASTSYVYYDDASFTNPQVISWSSNYSSAIGKWTCFSTDQTATCDTPVYIAGVYSSNSSYAYYDPNGNSQFKSYYKISYSDGVYTLSGDSVAYDFQNIVSGIFGSGYFCSDLSNSCSTVYYYSSGYGYSYGSSSFSIGSKKFTGGEPINTNNQDIVYGSSVTYSNGVYTLNDTTTSKPANWSSDRTTLANGKHYTCLTTSSTCSSVYYITYFGSSSTVYYITLNSGETIENVKTKAFANTNDSTIKTKIDTWYSNNLSRYSRYLENTIFCNDRSLSSGTLGGTLSSESSNSTSDPYFAAYERLSSTYSPSLTCINQNDRFSLSTENSGTKNYGNNALTYPVGLITADEINLAGGSYDQDNYDFYLYTGNDYWTLSPLRLRTSNSASMIYLTSYGNISTDNNDYWYGIRPVVSLKSKIYIKSGNGSFTNPYIVE